MKAKKCKGCGKEMKTSNPFQKTCSDKCRYDVEKIKKKMARTKLKDKFGTTAKVSTLKTQADRVFSDYIRNRDNFTCVTCGMVGDRGSVDNGHYIPRQVLAIRYDETNCHSQCKSCNGRHNIDREPYRKWMIEKYGESHIEWLSEQSKVITKGSKDFFLKIKEKYK